PNPRKTIISRSLSLGSPLRPPPRSHPKFLHGWRPEALGHRRDPRASIQTLRSEAAVAAAMQGLPGGVPDPQQLQATMLAIEQACSLIQ
uniref:Uncharacterized protein n=1 Tax=Aegilops tauschii subsp. strangulata TaxID=200361 RepID=A0A452YFK6_AEGTS